jgi:hypothetical protein
MCGYLYMVIKTFLFKLALLFGLIKLSIIKPSSI